MPHIPSCESNSLSLLSFSEALAASGRSGGYDADRWLYVPDFYTEYRYILGTRGKNPLICIGINPSTAAPDALDNTLKSVSRIAEANGYDSFLMFNVYAQRATDPDLMDTVFNSRLHEENSQHGFFRQTSSADFPRPSRLHFQVPIFRLLMNIPVRCLHIHTVFLKK